MPTKALSRKYDDTEIEAGLFAVAACGGNAERASRELKERGMLDVPSRTLRYWVRTLHSERYWEIVNTRGKELEDLAMGQARELIVAIGEVERLALQKTREALAGGKIQDPARTLRNLSVSKIVNIDRLLTLSGRPNEIHAQAEDASTIMNRLQNLWPGLFVKYAEPEEPPEAPRDEPEPVDAEVVPEPPDPGDLIRALE